MANSIAWDWNTFREWVNLTSSTAHRLLYYKFRLQAPNFFTLKQPNIIQKTGNVIMSLFRYKISPLLSFIVN